MLLPEYKEPVKNQPGSSFASFDGNGNMATADSEAGAEDSAIGCRSEGSRGYSAISMSPLWPAGQRIRRTRIFLFIEDEECPEEPSSQRSEFANGTAAMKARARKPLKELKN